jgi:hypothetical protein
VTWNTHKRLIIFTLLLAYGGFCFLQGYSFGAWRAMREAETRLEERLNVWPY